MEGFKITEADVESQFITPAIEKAGWDKATQIHRQHYFTDNPVIVRGNVTTRGQGKRADYLLSYKNHYPLAVVEAKVNSKGVGAGIQQAIDYARILDVPFAYSSNGEGFLEHDMTSGKENRLKLEEFPSPETLWGRYLKSKNVTPEQEKVINTPYYYAFGEKSPRYYQRIAINRAVDAVARGQKRILLVMATGTGKTYTAFQIIHRLRESKLKKKILFLADRNILVDQTMSQDFHPFQGKMWKVENRTIDTAYEVYLALYQQLAENETTAPLRALSRDFFDLIIVDECHRGSAKDDSSWRGILDYFESATQIGMTATPKETSDVSTTSYFGEPIYTYSLKQGIDDGFLAPYKVIRVSLDKDLEWWRPTAGQEDDNGLEIEDREYNTKDFDRTIILPKRVKVVAERITRFLKETDRFAKTIVFCVDTDHAERMREALVNENSDLVKQDARYIMRITGDDTEGKAQLDNFISVDSTYPVVVTTSELLTTGVDCKTCRLIVLDKSIQSKTEFKQIIGRGTRLRPDKGKEYFTIMDFRNASRHFADPAFDGEPISVQIITDGGPIVKPRKPPTPPPTPGGGGKPPTERKKYWVGDVEVTILNERVQYYDHDGKLTTESITDYSKRNILGEYATLDVFLQTWNSDRKKKAIVDELRERGVFLEALREEAGNRDLDDFDLICHIAYDQPPLTKAERAKNVQKRGYFNKYSGLARQVLDALLEKYMDEGIQEMENIQILLVNPFSKLGTPQEITKAFGGKDQYEQAVRELQRELYVA